LYNVLIQEHTNTVLVQLEETPTYYSLDLKMWQPTVSEDQEEWSQESRDQQEESGDQQELLPARLWPGDSNELVVYHHAGYRYKRTIDPARVVVGYIGDFGKDLPYLTRADMMQAVRLSVRFCEGWLHTFVASMRLPNSYRLRRNMREATREPRFRDLLEYERYLRWNVEYRFLRVANNEIKFALACVRVPVDHTNIILSYLC